MHQIENVNIWYREEKYSDLIIKLKTQVNLIELAKDKLLFPFILG